VGFDRAHPCFSLDVWFQRERCETLLTVTIMELVFSFHGEVSRLRMSLKSGTDRGLAMVVLVFVAMRNWLGDFLLE
jgi:hypothetical protein